MFEQQIYESLLVLAKTLQDQINTEAAKAFIGKAQDWATNAAINPSTAGPPPIAPLGVTYTAVRETGDLKAGTTGAPVSALDPRSLLPVYGTDKDAVGGPIGGPIPGSPGKFYVNSSSHPTEGEELTVSGSKYRFQRGFFGLSQYWVKL